jgi:hypothetical protein
MYRMVRGKALYRVENSNSVPSPTRNLHFNIIDFYIQFSYNIYSVQMKKLGFLQSPEERAVRRIVDFTEGWPAGTMATLRLMQSPQFADKGILERADLAIDWLRARGVTDEESFKEKYNEIAGQMSLKTGSENDYRYSGSSERK